MFSEGHCMLVFFTDFKTLKNASLVTLANLIFKQVHMCTKKPIGKSFDILKMSIFCKRTGSKKREK
jgi:hypothetical protein